MEYGVRQLLPKPFSGDPRRLCPDELQELMPEGFLSALYFGTEFCQDLLPDSNEATEFCLLAKETGMEAVLLTPVIRADGLGRLQALINDLETRGCAPTIVFNDFGVLHLLRKEHPAIKYQAGRLFNRALRDPRLAEHSVPAQSPESGRGEAIRHLLRRFNVAGLETDPDLVGGYLGDTTSGLQRVLHLPYTFVTSGRNCLHKAEGQKDNGNFANLLSRPCPAHCRGRWQREERADLEFPLWRVGNTLFYEATRGVVEAHLDQVDRIVVHERPLL